MLVSNSNFKTGSVYSFIIQSMPNSELIGTLVNYDSNDILSFENVTKLLTTDNDQGFDIVPLMKAINNSTINTKYENIVSISEINKETILSQYNNIKN